MIIRAALVLALLTSPAFASAADDYVACLIGQSAVALHNRASKDEALEIAYDLCGELVAAPTDEDSEGLGDYVSLMVERMASE